VAPPPAVVATAPPPVPAPPPVAAPNAPAGGIAAAQTLVREAAGGVAAEEVPATGGAASSGLEPVARWGGKLAGMPADRFADRPAETGLCATGQKVEVLWEREWWPATVRAAVQPDGRCPVHYDGFGREYDESVPPHRLRARGR
ncbi:MAG TPA: hypothetical protein VED21_37855, partial [Azospirillum sp.]|nr:hypothetical protein [Azospirillum sp.]